MGSMLGAAMQELSDMLKKPAGAPEETPVLVTELLEKMQRLEDIIWTRGGRRPCEINSNIYVGSK